MTEFKCFLAGLPKWCLSGLATVAILWLTLSAAPFGEHGPSLFEGADKVVHGLMFGGLAAAMLLDWQRVRGWRRAGWQRASGYGVCSSAVGICIEFVQRAMGLGRGFEVADMVADSCGSAIVVILWLLLQPGWSEE